MNESKIPIDELLRTSHGHPIDILTEALGVNVRQGLTEQEVRAQREKFGSNVLEETSGERWWKLLLNQFSSIVVWLLLVAAVTAWLTNGPIEGLAIVVVLFLNAAIGFSLEWRAGRALDALRREAPMMVRVRRDGRELSIPASELVVPDIVALSAGDRVPADIRLIESVNLYVNESALTGESLPVGKSIQAVDHTSILSERRSMAYLGTIVTSGRAIGLVTATGPRTELGLIGRLLSKTDSEKTPLERKLAHLGAHLVYIVLAIAFVVFLIGLWRGDDPLLMLEISISLAVAAVPEGLPAVTTLILAIGVLRMARSHAIVRRLAAVEALGSATTICTDKTGTLTENRLTVEKFYLSDGTLIDLSNHGNTFAANNVNLKRLITVSVLCNDAAISTTAASGDCMVGDPTETALLMAARNIGCDIDRTRSEYKKLAEQPFDSCSKRMTVILNDTRGKTGLVAVKGAPAVILDASSRFIDESGNLAELTAVERLRLLKINESMAARGLRVLAFADKSFDLPDVLTDGIPNAENCYTFLGFSGMSDPLREGTVEAIRDARDAGIRVIMLTGDQIKTAAAIAEGLDLASGAELCTVHASDISRADDNSFVKAVENAHVFARVSPEDKLRIVETLHLWAV